VALAARTPLLVVFDEFQSITSIEGAAAVLRTHLQHHYSRLGLVFAGSAPSAMRDVFTRHDQPFFNQADLVTIEPLDLAAVHAIVAEGFAATDRDPGRGGRAALRAHRWPPAAHDACRGPGVATHRPG
jgi:hypothetical protein